MHTAPFVRAMVALAACVLCVIGVARAVRDDLPGLGFAASVVLVINTIAFAVNLSEAFGGQ